MTTDKQKPTVPCFPYFSVEEVTKFKCKVLQLPYFIARLF